MARGDVIFFRPQSATSIEDLDPANFDQFPIVAAYAQTFPYGPDDFRPWHHVAVSVTDDDSQVTGFVPPEYWPGDRQPSDELTPPRIVGDADGPEPEGFDALRPPPDLVEALLEAAEAQLGTVYSAAGLIPFAAMTAAWMLPDEFPGRAMLRRIAFGASLAAREKEPAAESCTTALAHAVEKSRGEAPLVFREPPSPAVGMAPTREFLEGAQVQAILALIARFDHSLRPHFERELVNRPARDVPWLSDRVGLGAEFPEFLEGLRDVRVNSFADYLPDLAPDAIADWDHVDRALNLMALGNADLFRHRLPGDNYYPGGDVTFGAYMARVRVGAEIFDKDTDFEDRGLRHSGEITSDDFLISPAMLWEALIDAGFTAVEH
jgi:hypothetical protein